MKQAEAYRIHEEGGYHPWLDGLQDPTIEGRMGNGIVAGLHGSRSNPLPNHLPDS